MDSTVNFEFSSSDFPLPAAIAASPVMERYESILETKQIESTTFFEELQEIGRGGQSVVFRSDRNGADSFTLPVAVKVFSPAVYACVEDYEVGMQKVSRSAAQVAAIQHDHLLDVHNFGAQGDVRFMVMEWINGFDLRRLLKRETLDLIRGRVNAEQMQRLDHVVLTCTTAGVRVKPGIAIQILRECLSALAALHRAGLVHGDVKPSNIMLKRTGNAKIVDIGSGVNVASPIKRRVWTPAYAAPEILEGAPHTPQSDLASLGYVLIEMLAGEPPFEGIDTVDGLRRAKREFKRRLPSLLPPEILTNSALMNLCDGLVEYDSAHRIQSAEQANRDGAAVVHRQLVHIGLDSDYEDDIRLWVDALPS